MKKLFITIFFCLTAHICFGQNQEMLSVKDSIMIDNIYKAVSDAVAFNVPRYKMYNTENIYHLIKLDTATGRIWQVQYRMGDAQGRVAVIDDVSLLQWYETPVNGRYELYPTNNMYTFILIDNKFGYTYQVQWHPDPDNRFREILY